jgi:ketosteroid isomerase-like protein
MYRIEARMSSTRSVSPSGVLRRLAAATSAHDLDALVDCFADDYANETPAHPARGFTGRAQVRSNWEQIFGAVPDLRATVLRSVEDGSSEWELAGTRRDGAPHLMRGVVVFVVRGERFGSARFYLEPVVDDGLDATAAARAAVGGGP